MFSLKKKYTNLVFVFLQSLSWRHDLTDKIRSPKAYAFEGNLTS